MVTPKFSGVNFPSGVQIMAGLNTPWSAVHDEVIQEVSRLIGLYPDYTLESTGHSLGGALTYLSYIALAQNFPEKNIHSNALAAFPIGNQAFADFGSAQHGTLWRGNNAADGVPVSVTFISFLRLSLDGVWKLIMWWSRICMSHFHTTWSTMAP
jgi:hypothetical protein